MIIKVLLPIITSLSIYSCAFTPSVATHIHYEGMEPFAKADNTFLQSYNAYLSSSGSAMNYTKAFNLYKELYSSGCAAHYKNANEIVKCQVRAKMMQVMIYSLLDTYTSSRGMGTKHTESIKNIIDESLKAAYDARLVPSGTKVYSSPEDRVGAETYAGILGDAICELYFMSIHYNKLTSAQENQAAIFAINNLTSNCKGYFTRFAFKKGLADQVLAPYLNHYAQAKINLGEIDKDALKSAKKAYYTIPSASFADTYLKSLKGSPDEAIERLNVSIFNSKINSKIERWLKLNDAPKFNYEPNNPDFIYPYKQKLIEHNRKLLALYEAALNATDNAHLSGYDDFFTNKIKDLKDEIDKDETFMKNQKGSNSYGGGSATDFFDTMNQFKTLMNQ